MTNAFEYGDALLHPQESIGGEQTSGDKIPPIRVESNQPYLNLATCVVFTICNHFLIFLL
jgi:hypothetical protein